jgi:hypothetical protein
MRLPLLKCSWLVITSRSRDMSREKQTITIEQLRKAKNLSKSPTAIKLGLRDDNIGHLPFLEAASLRKDETKQNILTELRGLPIVEAIDRSKVPQKSSSLKRARGDEAAETDATRARPKVDVVEFYEAKQKADAEQLKAVQKAAAERQSRNLASAIKRAPRRPAETASARAKRVAASAERFKKVYQANQARQKAAAKKREAAQKAAAERLSHNLAGAIERAPPRSAEVQSASEQAERAAAAVERARVYEARQKARAEQLEVIEKAAAVQRSHNLVGAISRAPQLQHMVSRPAEAAPVDRRYGGRKPSSRSRSPSKRARSRRGKSRSRERSRSRRVNSRRRRSRR